MLEACVQPLGCGGDNPWYGQGLNVGWLLLVPEDCMCHMCAQLPGHCAAVACCGQDSKHAIGMPKWAYHVHVLASLHAAIIALLVVSVRIIS